MNLTQLQTQVQPVDILLVDDDEGDVLLTQKVLEKGKIFNSLSVARDGVEALRFLRKEGEFTNVPRPDLVLLDLNMPRMDGKETLKEIKRDPNLKTIPIVVLTTSDADQDVIQSYNLQANCYVTKPVDLAQFTNAVQKLQDFWLCVVKFPRNQDQAGG